MFFPTSPREKIIYLATIVLAFGFTIGYITLKELLSNKILSPLEIRNYSNVPVIGEISHFKENNLSPTMGGNDFVSAQFRQLKAALGLFKKSTINKKMLVTSSISGEGKKFY